MLQTLLALPVNAWTALGLVLALVLYVDKATRQSLGGASRHRRLPHRLASALPIIGDTRLMLKNAPVVYEWLTEICTQLNGEPVELRALGRRPMIVLTSPSAFEDVLKTQFDAFPKGSVVCETLRDLLGHGIFAVDHAQWVRQRKIAANLFTMRALRDSMSLTIQTHTRTLHSVLLRAASDNESSSIDLFQVFNRFTMEAFAEIGFGIQMNCLERGEDHELQRAFDETQRLIRRRFVRPSWFWKTQRLLGVGAEQQLKKNLAVLNDTVLGIVGQALEQRASSAQSESTADPSERPPKATLVSLFLDHSQSLSNNAEDAAILRDMVINFLLAGRDTTAQTLSWLVYRLSQHPEVTEKIRREIQAAIPELDNGAVLSASMQQVEELVYLEAALKETLRLHPPVAMMNKIVARDTVLSDGTFIPAQSMVSLFSYGMARMESVWGPDACEFKPERWIDLSTGKLRTVSAFQFPSFNAGPRVCLGVNLAMLEMKLVVSSLLSHFHVRVLPDQHVTYAVSVTLPMKHGLQAAISRRAATVA